MTPTTEELHTRRQRRRRRLVAWIAGSAAALIVAVTGFALLLRGPDCDAHMDAFTDAFIEDPTGDLPEIPETCKQDFRDYLDETG